MKHLKDFTFGRFIIVTLIIFLAVIGILKYTSTLTWSLRSVTIPKEDPFRVSAEGEVYVKPDTAEITLGVEKEAKTVAEVQTAVNEVNNRLIKGLKGLGVEKEKIKTTRYSINPRYEWERKSGERRLVGYQATVSILVKTKDLGKLNQIIDQATEAGVNKVNSLNFVVEDKDQARAQARDQAIAKAKEKAKAIAKASGLSLGRLINVLVSGQGYYPVPRYYGLGAMAEEAVKQETQVEPGETKILVTVTLSYEVK
ncbi:SIMPL domain-containing protein [Patescibacteria group bacterium]|nr:SIMPL domain-containing protein [Patescibacteria group bacterium]